MSARFSLPSSSGRFALPELHVAGDGDARRLELPGPPAPKRRRVHDHGRAARLSGFEAAARAAQQRQRQSDSATIIQAHWRGCIVRRQLGRLRPTSSQSSLHDDIPEEIVCEDTPTNHHKDALTLLSHQMAIATVATDGRNIDDDSAFESSTDFESSADSTGSLSVMCSAVQQQQQQQQQQQSERTCAICLNEMKSRRRHSAVDHELPLSVTALECSHRFHRRCLLNWVRQQPPGECPLCRQAVAVVTRKREVRSSGGPASTTP